MDNHFNFYFPPVHYADKNGLLAIGGDYSISTLLVAYHRGIFPWPISENSPIAWFSPDPRGIIHHDDFKITTSFKKFLKHKIKNQFQVEFNKNFRKTITNCMSARVNSGEESWINQDLIEGYCELHKRGYAYSVETYLGDEMVGGIYGVCINGYFTGESMFYTVDNASKFALYSLMNRLQKIGVQWLDTQMVTPVVQSFGGKNITRDIFMKLLDQGVNSYLTLEFDDIV
jgi:leucyl/phenylalanyl-tRNA---protein transferase